MMTQMLQRRLFNATVFFGLASGLLVAPGCGQKSTPDRSGAVAAEKQRAQTPSRENPEVSGQENSGTPAATTPDDLPYALLIAYAQFVVEDGAVTSRPGPARLDILRREGGAWVTDTLEDPDSAVFHKAMVVQPKGKTPGIVTLGGSAPCPEDADAERDCQAQLKLWRRNETGWAAEMLWQADFGGQFNRMRDAEVGALFSESSQAIAVGTHDQGVVATISFEGDEPQVARLDEKPNTWVHEIELGDLDGDGKLEVYATPSEPNRLRHGGEQHGEVVRYDPRKARSANNRRVVADLGNRHAKEIMVTDVDGDGRDELYVAVEALTSGTGAAMQVVEPVEIRRYDADTAPDAGVVIATIQDRFTRFLTAGDLDGDGKKEIVAASFKNGLWLLQPGADPRSEWSKESIDRDSGGFEHAALIADLDQDGTDELYVAADEQGELRRYQWRDGHPDRETILRRELPRSRMTWNLMPVPLTVIRPEAD